MRLLLHTCCSICIIKPWELLTKEGYNVTAYFYNPTIHPFQEQQARRKALHKFCQKNTIDLLEDDEYNLISFLRQVTGKESQRCRYCYTLRLERTAKLAQELNIAYFSTTLLISPYQKHELLKEIGNNLAQKYGLEFIYYDFRPYFRASNQEHLKLNLYRQKYCGCIYSEAERYKVLDYLDEKMLDS